MTSEDYGWITTEIMTVADSCCCGRVVSVSSLGSSLGKTSSEELPKVKCEVKMKIQVEDETEYLSGFDNVKQNDMNIDSFSSYDIQCNERHGCDITSTSVTLSPSSSSSSCAAAAAAAAAAHVRRLVDPYGPLTFITPPSHSLPSSNSSSSSSSNGALTSAVAVAVAQPSYSLHTVNLYQSFPSSGTVATYGIHPSSSSSSSSSLSPPPIALSLTNDYSSNTDVSHSCSPNDKKNNLIINLPSTSTLHSSLTRPEPSSCPSSSSASSSLSALVPELFSITESVIPISSLPNYSILSPSHNEIVPSKILSFHPSYNRNNSTLLRHSISSDDNYEEKEKNKHDLLKNEIQSLEMTSKEEKELKLQNKISNHFNNKNSNIHEIL